MKKIISILVSVCLLLMVSAPLFALDVVGEKNVAVYNESGEWQKISVYDGLEKAVKYAKDGDIIDIDVDNFSINVRLSDVEIAKRKAEWKYQGKKVESKWLRQYQKLVTNASNGGILEA